MAGIFDSHRHYDDSAFDEDREELLGGLLNEGGVEKIIHACAKFEDALSGVLMSEKYDYIIIDTPPVNIVSDCQLIVRAVQGIVFVVRYKVSQYKDLELAAENIRNIDGNILGVVINDVKERKGPLSRRYYRHYYSYVENEV